MSRFSAEEKAVAARCEETQLYRVYVRLVGVGLMTEKEAKLQIAIMREIVDDYEMLANIKQPCFKLN